jgi:hypothetical protein
MRRRVCTHRHGATGTGTGTGTDTGSGSGTETGTGTASRRTLSVTLALRMNCCETLPSSWPCRNSCRSTKCCHAMLCNGRAQLACRMPFRKAHALHRSPDRSCPTQRPALPPQAICPNCRATLQGLVGCYQRPTTSIVRWSTRLWSVAIGAFCCTLARWLHRSIGARIRAAVVVRGIVNSVRAGARRRGDEPGFCALNSGVRVSRSVVNSVHTEPRRNSEKGTAFWENFVRGRTDAASSGRPARRGRSECRTALPRDSASPREHCLMAWQLPPPLPASTPTTNDDAQTPSRQRARRHRIRRTRRITPPTSRRAQRQSLSQSLHHHQSPERVRTRRPKAS